MLFNSPIFIFLFLPVVFILHCLVKKKIRNILLLLSSLYFYAWGEPRAVFLMILSILFNWKIGKIIGKSSGQKKRAVLIAGIVCDLGMLGYYKYFGALVEIALPIGISFFTFQAISYIIDVYRGETEAASSLVNVALYISFFPQLIAGPIVKYRDIDSQIREREISAESVAGGFKRFVYGLVKKVLLVNTLGLCADTIYGYQVTAVDGIMAWVGALAYGFQIYYDFSGYSDMAIGLGAMFGFTIPENFRYPYLSKSVSEFWRRWHISLGSWFREYVYIPLGGSRKGRNRTYWNLVVVFFLTGLWHGARYTFVLWGLYHCAFVLLEKAGLQKWLDKSKVLAVGYCFTVVNFGWVIFREDSIRNALQYMLRMIIPWRYLDIVIQPWNYMDRKTLFIGVCAVAGSGILKRIVPVQIAEKWKNSIVEALYIIILLVLSLASIASDTYNPFIYFQF